jgi:hypothetical protein
MQGYDNTFRDQFRYELNKPENDNDFDDIKYRRHFGSVVQGTYIFDKLL